MVAKNYRRGKWVLEEGPKPNQTRGHMEDQEEIADGRSEQMVFTMGLDDPMKTQL